MANNRILIWCKECGSIEKRWDHSEVVKRPFFAIAKWYPDRPYYTVRENNETLNAWFDYHSHGSQEFPFRFEYESPPETLTK